MAVIDWIRPAGIVGMFWFSVAFNARNRLSVIGLVICYGIVLWRHFYPEHFSKVETAIQSKISRLLIAFAGLWAIVPPEYFFTYDHPNATCAVALFALEGILLSEFWISDDDTPTRRRWRAKTSAALRALLARVVAVHPARTAGAALILALAGCATPHPQSHPEPVTYSDVYQTEMEGIKKYGTGYSLYEEQVQYGTSGFYTLHGDSIPLTGKNDSVRLTFLGNYATLAQAEEEAKKAAQEGSELSGTYAIYHNVAQITLTSKISRSYEVKEFR